MLEAVMSQNGKATLKDVALHAGVSVGSISRFINQDPSLSENLYNKIETAIKELHFVPNEMARQLARGDPSTIIIYILHEYPICPTTWLYELPIIQSVDMYLRQTKYALQIELNSYLDKEGSYQFVKKCVTSRRVSGILFISAWGLDQRIIKYMNDRNFPYALIGNKNTYSNFNEVLFDNQKAISDLVERLYKEGHRKFAFFGGYRDQQHTTERYAGFYDATAKYELLVDRNWVKFGDYSMDSATQFMNEMLTMPELPTAVICGNDYLAAGVTKAAAAHSRQCAFEITGFDNTIVSDILAPPIMTVAVPLAEIGEMATKILLDNLKAGASAFKSRVLECTIIDKRIKKAV